jgi:hypothetical protein
METKHTPGPWKVRFLRNEDPESGFFVEAKNNNIPDIGYGIEILGDDYGDHNGYPAEQRLADARLIAAAPEMLKILHLFVESDDMPGWEAKDRISYALNLAKEVIQKTTS